jgi:pimeloyl-ACP methyl ester carboxylesterase
MKAKPEPIQRAATAAIVLLALMPATSAAQSITRTDHRVPSAAGIELFVREVTAGRAGERSAPPVLLLHGATVPSLPSFDLPVPQGSLAVDLATAGFRVYLMDARGFGGSTRQPRMNEPPEGGAPLTRSSEVLEDVNAVVDWIRKRTRAKAVTLMGWETGGHWAGLFATRHPAKVAGLVLYNTLYGGGTTHRTLGHGSSLEDPKRRGTFNPALGAYRFQDAASLMRTWDQSIPVTDKASWRDPAVATAYVRLALASDPTAGTRNPPSLRAPSGPLADTFELAIGRHPWDAGLIQSPTLILAAERDFWSRAEDRDRLKAHLVNAPAVTLVILREATHFVHLDRPERGRGELLTALTAFLQATRT